MRDEQSPETHVSETPTVVVAPLPPTGGHAPLPRPRDSRSPLGLFGLPELAALAAALILLLAAVGSYLFVMRPQQVRAQELTVERATLERQLPGLRSSMTQNQDTQTSVREILDSLQNFETEHLGQGANGSTNVIEELNGLIRKNSLRISGGLAFTQLEETVPGTEKKRQQQPREPGASGATSASRTVQSVFPGIGITLTVEGTYPNLRHFIKNVEASRQFIVIDAVELESITDNGGSTSSFTETETVPTAGANIPGAPPLGASISNPKPSGANPASASVATARTGGARGTLVSLRLDMAAYFRRTNAQIQMTAPVTTAGTGTSR